ncbi:ABC-2 type transport system permease protein [Arboricoccus pini]|uniref:Transport permease protein n=1 Tax=Arboricoccus pini TaxID=1963835 RepID=A0A212R8R6_9PROT|nr:ABC transporter permease [Arboricoccus pini]SNB68569.1 ABC-2 type transport system permease protein [Arboricoccus pini]
MFAEPEQSFVPAELGFDPRRSVRRMLAVMQRHLFLLTGSWPRLFELVYWPTVQMILWGFITRFLVTESSFVAQSAGIFLSAVLLWDTLFRGQLGFSLAFLEELYARHLGHLFVSPLRPWELVVAVFGISLVRVLVGIGGAMLLAVPIFHFWLPGVLGWALLPFFAMLLMFGWSIGLIIAGCLLRLGLGAESLAWGIVFLLQPLSGVYYPVKTLPGFLQPIAWCLPSAHVFEGMRAVLVENSFDLTHFFLGLLTLAVWMAVAAFFFILCFRHALREGLLLRQGE